MARLTPILLVCAALAGCGGDEPASPTATTTPGADVPGKEQFASTCGNCHTLAAAGTNGAVGPPLDGLGLDASAVAAKIDQGGGSMPADLLTGTDRDTVANYVAEVAR